MYTLHILLQCQLLEHAESTTRSPVHLLVYCINCARIICTEIGKKVILNVPYSKQITMYHTMRDIVSDLIIDKIFRP